VGGHAVASARRAGDRPPSTRTIVSIEFDHGFSDQQATIALANRYGLKVTVFAISGRIGATGYMTAPQLSALQAAGNEIGGHTIDHPDLSMLSSSVQQQEICGDRVALQALGFDVTDFAYPYGHYNAATPGIVRSCGYQSARGTGGIESQGGCYGPCPPAESIPPQDFWVTRSTNSVLETTTLATIERYVVRAEQHGGGWVQIVFHHICDMCNLYGAEPQTAAAFFAWLAKRAKLGTHVETVRQVIQTPFVPRPITIVAPHRTGAHVDVATRCPRTPPDTPCTSDARARRATLRIHTGTKLLVRTPPGARSVSLELPRAVVHARPHGSARSRWSLVARGAGKRTLVVSYPLGVATYLVRFVSGG
jgi:peptidoglycan/xylan/chitin deacetylase (PgdA/CDA1 family)